MKTRWVQLLTGCAILTVTPSLPAIDRYVSLSGGHAPPFTDWAGAATNIQNAIDASSPGDTIWVTNGVYNTGGKVMGGDLTNRVTLDKPVTVQSVNGPAETIIEGAGTTNGLLAVRCAWLTNGANLQGFTLRGGATRTSGDAVTLRSGGGVWCANATDASVVGCWITSNAANAYGGGVYQGKVSNSLIATNSCSGSGGGAYGSTIANSAISKNASAAGGGAYGATLVNCTVIDNTGNSGGGVYGGVSTNCIIYYNQAPSGSNYSAPTRIVYSCTSPTIAGAGNTAAAPGLLNGGFYLENTSLCRGTALPSVVSGVDFYDHAWAALPSMGCAEWREEAAAGTPIVRFRTDLPGFKLLGRGAGQEPLSYAWLKDGVLLSDGDRTKGAGTNTVAFAGYAIEDAGKYQLIVSNYLGAVTSRVASVVTHAVDQKSTAPVPPFLDWGTAATNIQDAVEAALPGEIILVRDGIYSSGGKVKGGDLLNRVVIEKPLALHGVNGPEVTVIEGMKDPNGGTGPLAVRCLWITNDAVLSCFTLRNGGTRTYAYPESPQMNGGGVSAVSSNAWLLNCRLVGNVAGLHGGGAYNASLMSSIITENILTYGAGGGAYGGYLQNCAITHCRATTDGGASSSTLVNSAVAWNYADQSGGVGYSKLTNSIVFYNSCAQNNSYSNYSLSDFGYSCTLPLPAGSGNIGLDPQLVFDGHLSAASPCRGAGTNWLVTASDIDGQPWNSPPSIGCDEWVSAPTVLGSVHPSAVGKTGDLWMTGLDAAGEAPIAWSWLKNGELLSSASKYVYAATNLVIRNLTPQDAGDYQLVLSNSFGMATGGVSRLVVHCVDPAASNPTPPFRTWLNAATNIQDAIDIAYDEAAILVTNGIYAYGSRACPPFTLLNRVVILKPLAVMSVNGPDVTRIQGSSSPLPVRPAYLGTNASLNGFTLTGGNASGIWADDNRGGGVLIASRSSTVANSIVEQNTARYGGGASGGLLVGSRVAGNTATSSGGGTYTCDVLNSLIVSNSSRLNNGGFHGGDIVNCTITGNQADALGGGSIRPAAGSIRNCIIWGNSAARLMPDIIPSEPASFSCSPLLAGNGNINADPQFVDGIHIAATSPCRGAADPLYATGTDLEGNPWANPPSMGCLEVWDDLLAGPLTVGLTSTRNEFATGVSLLLYGEISGQAGRVQWSFGDEIIRTNTGWRTSYAWTNPGDYTVTFTAFNNDHPEGISATLPVHVIPLVTPLIATSTPQTNNFTLNFPTQWGVQYLVEQATNLAPPVAWQTLTTLTGSDAVQQVTDAYATNAARFYRVRIP